MGDWVLTLILLCVPLLNIILLLYWAMGGATAKSKRNYCRACLLFFVVSMICGLLFVFAFGGLAMLAGLQSQGLR
jgi:hypothetical protein